MPTNEGLQKTQLAKDVQHGLPLNKAKRERDAEAASTSNAARDAARRAELLTDSRFAKLAHIEINGGAQAVNMAITLNPEIARLSKLLEYELAEKAATDQVCSSCGAACDAGDKCCHCCGAELAADEAPPAA